MNDVDLQGVWWVPGRESDALSGRLQFTREGGAVLDLIGALSTPASGRVPLQGALELQSFPVLHGAASGGQLFTLYRVWQTGGTTPLVGLAPPTSQFAAEFLLLDAHIHEPELARISEVEASYSHLFDWAGLSRVQRTYIAGPDGAGIRDAHFSVLPQPPELEHSVELSFGRVSLRMRASHEFAAQDELRISQRLFFRVELSALAALDELLSGTLYHLRHVLTLGVGVPLAIEEMWVGWAAEADSDEEGLAAEERDSSDLAEEVGTESAGARPPQGRAPESGAEAPRRMRARVYFAESRRGTQSSGSRLRLRERMRFRLSDVSNEWPSILTRYFASAERLRPAYDLFFATLYGESLYVQNRFLNLAQAAETYHRRTDPSRPLADDLFEAVCREVLAGIQRLQPPIPDRARRSLEGKVQWWNEHPLRRRLASLWRDDDPLVRAVVGDPREFRALVVDVRNYLTHYSPTLESRVPTGASFVRLARRLEALLTVLLLREAGIPERLIERYARREGQEIREIHGAWQESW